MDHKGRKDPSAHLEEPHFKEAEVPLSPVFGSPKEERLWEYPIIQEQLVKVLTRAYARSLSQLPIFYSLPLTAKRKPRIFPINEGTYATLSLEDIVLESLQVLTVLGKKFLRIPSIKVIPGSIWEILTKNTHGKPSTRTSPTIIWLTFLLQVGINLHRLL